MISIGKAKIILTALWVVGSLFPLVILFLQTIYGTYYNGKESEAWGWFTSVIAPTLSLIISVLVVDALNQKPQNRPVGTLIFLLALLFSVLYLAFVNLVFLLGPRIDSAPLDLFKRASLGLGLAQGLMTATLGVFFTKESPKKGEKPKEE
ncbi:MAG: hypothetical protein WCF57_02655 [Pyrinomonadaceae bacterium]